MRPLPPPARTLIGRLLLFVFVFSELSLSAGLPFTDLEVLRLIDPIAQFEEESEVKKVVVKSVFNVPVRAEPTVAPCPSGSRRVTETGPCVPKVTGLKIDDNFLLQSFSLFNRRRPTTPVTPNRRRVRPTTPRYEPVPTYVLEENSPGVLLEPSYSHNRQGPKSTYGVPPASSGTAWNLSWLLTVISFAITSLCMPLLVTPATTMSPLIETTTENAAETKSTSSIQPSVITTASNYPDTKQIMGIKEHVAAPSLETTSAILVASSASNNNFESLGTTTLDSIGTTEFREMTTSDIHEFPTAEAVTETDSTQIAFEDSAATERQSLYPEVAFQYPVTTGTATRETSLPPSSSIIFRDENPFTDLYSPADMIIFPEEDDEVSTLPSSSFRIQFKV